MGKFSKLEQLVSEHLVEKQCAVNGVTFTFKPLGFLERTSSQAKANLHSDESTPIDIYMTMRMICEMIGSIRSIDDDVVESEEDREAVKKMILSMPPKMLNELRSKYEALWIPKKVDGGEEQENFSNQSKAE